MKHSLVPASVCSGLGLRLRIVLVGDELSDGVLSGGLLTRFHLQLALQTVQCVVVAAKEPLQGPSLVVRAARVDPTDAQFGAFLRRTHEL